MPPSRATYARRRHNGVRLRRIDNGHGGAAAGSFGDFARARATSPLRDWRVVHSVGKSADRRNCRLLQFAEVKAAVQMGHMAASLSSGCLWFEARLHVLFSPERPTMVSSARPLER